MRIHSSQLRGFGRVVTGSVLDCDKDTLEKQLQFYDPFLYIKWNTDKLGGQGCWEIRRAPEYGTYISHGTFNGGTLYTYERRESDLIHHVLDCPVLHYGLLGKIKSMDAWKHKDFNSHLENTAAEYEARARKSAEEEMRYDIKQHMREWRELASLVRSGANPSQFIKGIRGQ
jgi:hypothetical protein